MALIEYLQKSIYMNLIYEDRYQLILSGLWVTLLLTVVSFVLGTVLGITYNTVDNVADKMYVSDLANFWDYRVVVNCDCTALTFSTDGNVQNEAYDCQVNIEDGKMLPGMATTPSGMPADSLVYYVSFSDDENPAAYGYAKYKVSGYRRTGFASDEP